MCRVERHPGQLPWHVLSAMITTGAECVHCGSREDLVAHHRVPRRYGGPDHASNLEPVCRSCHPRAEQESIARAKLVWEDSLTRRLAGVAEPSFRGHFKWFALKRPTRHSFGQLKYEYN